MDISDIKDVHPITWGFVVMLVLVTIVPGLLLVFLFNEQLFMQVETVKLLFLSISITMPLWALNTFVCFFSEEDEMSVIERLQFNGLLGAFFSFLPLYAPALVKIFADIDYKCAVAIVGGLEVLALFLIVRFILRNRKKL